MLERSSQGTASCEHRPLERRKIPDQWPNHLPDESRKGRRNSAQSSQSKEMMKIRAGVTGTESAEEITDTSSWFFDKMSTCTDLCLAGQKRKRGG